MTKHVDLRGLEQALHRVLLKPEPEARGRMVLATTLRPRDAGALKQVVLEGAVRQGAWTIGNSTPVDALIHASTVLRLLDSVLLPYAIDNTLAQVTRDSVEAASIRLGAAAMEAGGSFFRDGEEGGVIDITDILDGYIFAFDAGALADDQQEREDTRERLRHAMQLCSAILSTDYTISQDKRFAETPGIQEDEAEPQVYVEVHGLEDAFRRVLIDPDAQGSRTILVVNLRPQDAAAMKLLVDMAPHGEGWAIGNKHPLAGMERASDLLHLLRFAALPIAVEAVDAPEVRRMLEGISLRLATAGRAAGGTFYDRTLAIFNDIGSYVHAAAQGNLGGFQDIIRRVDLMIADAESLQADEGVTIARRKVRDT